MDAEWHDAQTADTVALANAIVTAWPRNPDGPPPINLIKTIISDLTKGLEGVSVEAVQELDLRCCRVAVMVEVMARMVVQVIRGAERAGVTVNLDALASPYDVMTEFDDLEP